MIYPTTTIINSVFGYEMYATEIPDIQMLFLHHIFRCETKEKPSIATYIPWVLEECENNKRKHKIPLM